MADRRLTKKQQYWLGHLESWSKTPQSLRAYATRCALNAQTFYVARGRLISQGLWPARPGAQARGAKRFVRIAVPAGTRAPAMCQVHLPNGARVELSLDANGLDAVLRSVAAL